MENVVEIYKLNGETIEIVATSSGYDVIYHSFNKSTHLLKDVSLTESYAYIARYFYRLLRYLKEVCNYGNN